MRGSLGLFEAEEDGVTGLGFVFSPAKPPCGSVLGRGLGAWIFGVVCFGRGGSGSSSSDSDSDSDSDDSEDSESEDDSSFSSKNSKTLGPFVESGCCWWVPAPVDLRGCFTSLVCEGELFLTVLVLATGPWAIVLVLDTNEKVLFLPSFPVFL